MGQMLWSVKIYSKFTCQALKKACKCYIETKPLTLDTLKHFIGHLCRNGTRNKLCMRGSTQINGLLISILSWKYMFYRKIYASKSFLQSICWKIIFSLQIMPSSFLFPRLSPKPFVGNMHHNPAICSSNFEHPKFFSGFFFFFMGVNAENFKIENGEEKGDLQKQFFTMAGKGFMPETRKSWVLVQP